MIINDEYIIQIFFYIKNDNYVLKHNYENIFNNCIDKDEINTYINNRFKELSRSLKESLYRILYKIELIPKCPICNNYCYFRGGNIKEKLYFTTCNNKFCYGKYNALKRKETFIKKYGVDHIAKLPNFNNVFKFNNPQKNPIIKEKTRQSMLNKYGKSHALQINEFKEKQKQTCLERYGVEYASQSESFRKRVEATCLEKYGHKCSLHGEGIEEKVKQSNLKKYGVKNGGASKQAQQKIKQTLLKHYGVESYSKTDKFKNDMHILMSSEKMRQKIYDTQTKNKSFNQSKTEELSFNILKQVYPDTMHHYKDINRYPFICDFYIPSLDLFIECQYGMYHNHRPYLNTLDDKKEVELLKQKSEQRKKISGKNKSRYDSVIYTWTILDPKKRNIAKENNLNYIEFWNINELKQWLIN